MDQKLKNIWKGSKEFWRSNFLTVFLYKRLFCNPINLTYFDEAESEAHTLIPYKLTSCADSPLDCQNKY